MFKCEICSKKVTTKAALSKHISCENKKDTHPSKEDYYLYILNNKKDNICKNENCNKSTKFRGIFNGYAEFCSIQCVTRSKIIRNRSKKTNLERYGVEHASQSKEIKEKSKRTCLEKYGVENAFQNKEIQKKYKNTLLKKYGVEHNSQTKSYKKKYKDTLKIKYNVENISQVKEFQDKKKKTSLENYGVDNPMKSEVVKEKFKQTCKEKYGVENVSQVKEFKEKSKRTCLEKYGVEYANQNDIIKEKIKKTSYINNGGYSFHSPAIREKIEKTNLEIFGNKNPMKTEKGKKLFVDSFRNKYGVDNPSQVQEIREKIENTNLEKYGTKYFSQSNEFKFKMLETSYNRLLNSDRLKGLVIPLFNLKEYNGICNYYIKYPFICIKCTTNFKDHLMNGHIPRCPTCYPKLNGTSVGEQEVLTFVKQYYSNVESGNREILDGKEIDIYIPEIKLGIEYNGLYWHSERMGVNKNYHQDKHLLAKSKGVHLIQIFEDEWLNKRDIVKSILLNKMGKSPNKVFARKCQIQKVDNKIAKQFLFDNHLQGGIQCTHIGIYFENALISMISMGKSRFNKKYDYEILRFCNKINTSVIGGLSKLLSHFKKLNPGSSIITYADARYGEGTGYLNSGFKYKELTNPNYFYLKNNGRENRMKYQKHKLKDLLESFDSTLTEWQNMQLNGFDRIWDCGNYKYGMAV